MESVAEFSIPLAIVEKLMKREDNPTKENVIFNIDVPYLIKKWQKMSMRLWKYF